MRKLLLVALILLTTKVHAQTPPAGDLIPWAEMQFLNGSGVILTGGKLCSYVEGTTTPQKTYATPAIPPDGAAVENTNPVIISSNGRPTTNGIYLIAGRYKFVLRTAGTDTTCATGTVLWTADGIYNLAQLFTLQFATKFDDKVCHASQILNGSYTWGARVQECHDQLPGGGGTIDARGLEGAQSMSVAVVFHKPIDLEIGASYISSTVTNGASVQLFAGSHVHGCGIGCSTLAVTVNGGNADAINPAANTLIENMSLVGNTTHTAGQSAIDGCNCVNVEIRHVEMGYWGGHCLNSGGNDTNGHWDIHDNNIHNCYDDGVLLGGVGGHQVHDNQFSDIGSNSVDLNSPNNKIFKNHMIRNGANYVMGGTDCDAVFISSIYGNADDNEVDGNTIDLAQCSSVRIRADLAGHTNGTKVRGNTMSNGVSGAGRGVLLDASVGASCGTVNYTLIDGNRIFGMAADGILQGGGAGAPCIMNGLNVTNNFITDNTGTAVYTAFGTGGTISHNIILNNGGTINHAGSNNIQEVCNKTSLTVNVCPIDGALELDTMQPHTSSFVTLTTPGNTQFTLNSTGAGRRPFSLLLDGAGGFNIYDDTVPAVRMNFAAAGGVNASSSLTVGSGGYVSKFLTGFGTLDFPNTLAQTSSDLTVTVTGAADMDMCVVGPAIASLAASSTYTCHVSAGDTVTVRFNNYSAGAINPASGQFKVFLVRF